MQKKELMDYWISASEIDFRAMDNLYTSGDYVWSLFLGHLVIEKLLKAIAVKNDVESIPKIHDLNKLASGSGLIVEEAVKDLFDVITSFNIEARYPDYKKEFYKKCDREYAAFNVSKIKEIRSWLLEILNN